MPHKIADLQGPEAKERAGLQVPLGPGFSEEIISRMGGLRIIGSGISDPGPDYCEFIAYDFEGNEIAKKRIEGY